MEKYCKKCGRVFEDNDFKLCPYCGNDLETREGRQTIPRRLRHEVFKRDGYRCRECGASKDETKLEIDHILPVARGGTNDIDNLQTLCRECNRMKYTDEWVGGESDLETIKNELNLLNEKLLNAQNKLTYTTDEDEIIERKYVVYKLKEDIIEVQNKKNQLEIEIEELNQKHILQQQQKDIDDKVYKKLYVELESSDIEILSKYFNLPNNKNVVISYSITYFKEMLIIGKFYKESNFKINELNNENLENIVIPMDLINNKMSNFSIIGKIQSITAVEKNINFYQKLSEIYPEWNLYNTYNVLLEDNKNIINIFVQDDLDLNNKYNINDLIQIDNVFITGNYYFEGYAKTSNISLFEPSYLISKEDLENQILSFIQNLKRFPNNRKIDKRNHDKSKELNDFIDKETNRINVKRKRLYGELKYYLDENSIIELKQLYNIPFSDNNDIIRYIVENFSFTEINEIIDEGKQKRLNFKKEQLKQFKELYLNYNKIMELYNKYVILNFSRDIYNNVEMFTNLVLWYIVYNCNDKKIDLILNDLKNEELKIREKLFEELKPQFFDFSQRKLEESWGFPKNSKKKYDGQRIHSTFYSHFSDNLRVGRTLEDVIRYMAFNLPIPKVKEMISEGSDYVNRNKKYL